MRSYLNQREFSNIFIHNIFIRVLLLNFFFKNVLTQLLSAKNKHKHVRMLLNIIAFTKNN